MAQQQGESDHGQGARMAGGVLRALPMSLSPSLLPTILLWVLELETLSCG